MADNITAAYYYTNGNFSLESLQDFTAKDYLDTVIDSAEASEDLKVLAKSIKDFGHYVQYPLAEYNGWTVGAEHSEMDCADTNIEESSADVAAKLKKYALVRDTETYGIEKLEYDLELDSETTLNIYLTPKADYSGSVSAKLDSSNEEMAVFKNGVYCVTISGISAHKLGDTYKIHVNAGGEFDIEVSALSYADSVMNSAEDADMKKAVIALYKYYAATMKYRDADFTE